MNKSPLSGVRRCAFC